MSSRTLLALVLVGPLSFATQPGTAQELHGAWPIQNGVKHQPTRGDLRSLHEQDVPSNDAREIDRLYNELLSNGYSGTHHTGNARTR